MNKYIYIRTFRDSNEKSDIHDYEEWSDIIQKNRLVLNSIVLHCTQPVYSTQLLYYTHYVSTVLNLCTQPHYCTTHIVRQLYSTQLYYTGSQLYSPCVLNSTVLHCMCVWHGPRPGEFPSLLGTKTLGTRTESCSWRFVCVTEMYGKTGIFFCKICCFSFNSFVIKKEIPR